MPSFDTLSILAGLFCLAVYTYLVIDLIRMHRRQTRRNKDWNGQIDEIIKLTQEDG